MAGEHFAVRIDVDPLALGLLEQFAEVLQVVAGDDDALAADGRHANLRRLGVAIDARVGRIQQFHHLEVQLAGLHRPAEQFVGGGVLAGEKIEARVERGVDLRVFMVEDAGVIGVGGGALQSVEDQFLQAGHVVAQADLPPGDRHLLGLPHQAVEIGGRLARRRGRKAAPASCPPSHRPPRRASGPCRGAWRRRADDLEPGGIEVDVRDRGEEEVEHGAVDLAVGGPQLGGPMGVHRNALGGMHQQVLQPRGGRTFAADAELRATGAFGRLLTLIAVHGGSPFVNRLEAVSKRGTAALGCEACSAQPRATVPQLFFTRLAGRQTDSYNGIILVQRDIDP